MRREQATTNKESSSIFVCDHIVLQLKMIDRMFVRQKRSPRSKAKLYHTVLFRINQSIKRGIWFTIIHLKMNVSKPEIVDRKLVVVEIKKNWQYVIYTNSNESVSTKDILTLIICISLRKYEMSVLCAIEATSTLQSSPIHIKGNTKNMGYFSFLKYILYTSFFQKSPQKK